MTRPSSVREDSYEDDKLSRDVSSPTGGLEGAKIEETIYNPELKAAIENTHLDPLGKRAIALYFACVVCFMNAVSNGAFDLPSQCMHVLIGLNAQASTGH